MAEFVRYKADRLKLVAL